MALTIVDTTVMEKAIAHPTDTRFYEKARRRLVALAQEAGLSLRQSYARLAPRLAGQVGRYAHARQFKRMQKGLRRLKGYTGRILRDIQRQLGAVTDLGLRGRIDAEIALVERLLRQRPKDRRKLYALHEPEVDCISKGKARVRYEFGSKVSVATTHKEGFVVGMRAMPGQSLRWPHPARGSRAMARRMKRLWTDEEKLSICLQTTAPGSSISFRPPRRHGGA